jgi:bifunctional DNA-binding transcriptional regulator/antitoxin component of YhaV-PrlF toxin-antitoxin module
MVDRNDGRYETRVRADGAIHVPAEILDPLAIYPGSRIRVFRDGDRLIVEKIEAAADPFAAAARGPDLSAMEKIQSQQKEAAQKARDKFEELMKKPPVIRPEDNKDLWR